MSTNRRSSNIKKYVKSTTYLSPLSLLVLSACGGASSDAESPFDGFVIDGPLGFATVFFDNDKDGSWDSDEPTTTTAADGSYSLIPTADDYNIVVTTDDDTIDQYSQAIVSGLTLYGSPTATVVSPLSTMMVSGNLTAAQVREVLGLDSSIDVENYNPFATGVDPDVALDVAKLNASISATLLNFAAAAEGAGMSSSDAFSAALNALKDVVIAKAELLGTGSFVALDLTDTDDIASISANVANAVSAAAAADSTISAVAFAALATSLEDAIILQNGKISEITDTDLTSDAVSNVFATIQAVAENISTAVADQKSGGSGVISYANEDFFNSTLNDVNDAPVGVADTLAATEDTAVTYAAADLLRNDVDPEGDTLSIKSVTSISGGTVILSDDGTTVTFTPTPDFNGAASFSYIATDGTADSAATTVTVNVEAVNDAAEIDVDGIVTFSDEGGVVTVTYVEEAGVDGGVATGSFIFSRDGLSSTFNSDDVTGVVIQSDVTLAAAAGDYDMLFGGEDGNVSLISGEGAVSVTFDEGGVYEFSAQNTLFTFSAEAAAHLEAALEEQGGSVSVSDYVQEFVDSDFVTDGDILYMGSGTYNLDLTINKSVTVLGANVGQAVHNLADTDSFVSVYNEVTQDLDDIQLAAYVKDELVNFHFEDQPRAFGEAVNLGTFTIATNGVTIDGMRISNDEGGIEFSGTDISNFSLKNSYVTGYNAGALRYDGVDAGTSTGWVLSGNLFGGVDTSEGNGGSLYLTGLSGSTIEGNVFWRPGAAHLYLEDVEGLTFTNNFFYHGLHAGGANFDGLLDDWGSSNGYGDGYGYGYGDGYGYGYGYGDGDAAYYGRNYWVEIKGVSSDITFDENLGLFNSGGIQIWDEDDISNIFTNFDITDNVFAGFINADPGGYLDTVSGLSRHVSGIMGGVVWSTMDESTSSGLTISGNTVDADLAQWMNDGDLSSLIYIVGAAGDVLISDNTIGWEWDGVDPEISSSAAILLARELIDEQDDSFVTISGNSLSHGALDDNTASAYESYAIYIQVEESDAADFTVEYSNNILVGYELPDADLEYAGNLLALESFYQPSSLATTDLPILDTSVVTIVY